MTKHYGGPNGHRAIGHGMQLTLGTVTAKDHHAVTTAFLTKCAPPAIHSDRGHLAEVRAFLIKYYAAQQGQEQQVELPLHTVTAKARFGLVTISGAEYEIADIGMRMLAPHELFAAQGFPPDYRIAPELNGKPLSKTAQIRCAGNSVCPPVAEKIVDVNALGTEVMEAA
jgi:DNA (cytosine-5)-methyltransferase 1